MARRKLLRSSFSLFALALGVTSGITVPAFALTSSGGTGINTTICNEAVTPVVAISAPESDTTLSGTSFTLQADVEYISQVDILIDDAYDKTIALAPNQANFSAGVSTTVGTHTIKVVGNGICGSGSAEDSIVLTIEPGTTPEPPITENPSQEGTPTDYSDPLSSDVETVFYDGVIVGGDAIVRADEGLVFEPFEAVGVVTPRDVVVAGLNVVGLKSEKEAVQVATIVTASAALVFQNALFSTFYVNTPQLRWGFRGGLVLLILTSLLLL